VSVAIALSRVTGLVREMVFARFFGAGLVYDAFSVAFRIPNLTRDLFAEGALSSAFVPVFTKYLTTRSKVEARELYNLVATALILVVGAVCLLGMIFSPQLVNLFAAPIHKVPGKFELAVALTRIMFPFLLLQDEVSRGQEVLQPDGGQRLLRRFGILAKAQSAAGDAEISFRTFDIDLEGASERPFRVRQPSDPQIGVAQQDVQVGQQRFGGFGTKQILERGLLVALFEEDQAHQPVGASVHGRWKSAREAAA
jgi:hypothetical protein